ncbi:DNA mismatch repair endonuclease MutL [Verrucomicrobiaceae bacterium 5K15]|uniref:DNA mismatch repair protein MutL n=1 Tax=Oceaniferula flava TaxID=2800421 RepID=A0AAE2SF77_9BACT|nr:DNA mismatch repair endonuclease MutL [Oceaniferula flavus]MBK1855887.1 DNA mismatch repair endonuclease MutL [Oceaniferula flavus]MBM1137194.1 DNA mismatch repair endonuclease MutL [Oceaniferula flavus]
MPKIQILDDTLASQVAAGEVVERPSSVVKELVENSLDAGAKHVTVEIQRGGTAMIRVTDDACGMNREDALLSLERHATSKLKNSEQLESILTLGFRGEAVPSIASVARFRMTTREKGSVAGTEIQVDGGTLRDVRDAGVPEGTSIEVKQIFFNVPARRKFLRAESTEFAHVEHQVRLHALAAPEVRFTLIKDGRPVFDLPAASDWRVRISSLAGSEAAGKLIEVKRSAGPGMVLRGYLLPADYARKGRRQQFVFLNGRPIEDSAISRALRDGYKGAVSDGVHPAAWLWIDMDPSLVDVNVHPAKKEVRFRRPFDVRNLIAEAVERSLAGDLEEPPPATDFPATPERAETTEQPVGSPVAPTGKKPSVSAVGASSQRVPVSPPAAPSQPSSPSRETSTSQPVFPHQVEQQEELTAPSGKPVVEQPDFRLIGPLHDRYVVLEGDEGVVLLDPVAARERIVYEDLLAAGSGAAIESQGLLVPELLELDAVDYDIVLRHAGHFAEAGMQVDSFGGTTVQVSSMPAFIKVSDVRGFLLELVDELHETVGSRRGKAMAFEAFATGLAKRVGRREPCRIDHAESLLTAMFACDLPYCTPDGRPTLIHISLNELDRKFGK